MSLGNTFENDLAKLIFQGTAITGIADAAASPLANFYLSLHTADPGEGADQTTSEISYTGYSRVAVARPAGFTVTANVVTLAAEAVFGQMSAGTGGTVTHWMVGTASTSTGKCVLSGPVNNSIAVANGVQPKLGTGTSATFD